MIKIRSSLLTQPQQGQQLITTLLIKCAHSNAPLHIALATQVNNQTLKCYSTTSRKSNVGHWFIVNTEPNQHVLYSVILHVFPSGHGVLFSLVLRGIKCEVLKIVYFWNVVFACSSLQIGACYD
ncbi:hypothetical protein [uncultured Pseudoalteromonas sp.]|uniref:hypothetical protein n=1 Tax=uncultured Pseudoalteromonas sp. TaxID=114053 RepID=UPI0030D7A1CB